MAGSSYAVGGMTPQEAARKAISIAARDGCELGLSPTGMRVIGVNKPPGDYLQDLIAKAGAELREIVKRRRPKQQPGFTSRVVDGQTIVEKDGVSYPVEPDDAQPADPVRPERMAASKTDADDAQALVRFRRVAVPYTMVPNTVFELPKTYTLDPSAQAVLFQVIRQSFGYHHEATDVDLRTLSDDAVISYRTAIRAMEQLEGHGLIHRTRRQDAQGHRLADLISLTLPGVTVE